MLASREVPIVSGRRSPWIVAGALAACLGWLMGCAPSAPLRASTSPIASLPPLPPAISLAEANALAIAAAPAPDWVFATPQGVWVANVDPGLVRYGSDGTITAAVKTGLITSAMEVGFGSLWVSDVEGTQILRVDLADPTKVEHLTLPNDGPIPSESSLAVTDDGIWAITGGGSLLKVGPATNALSLPFAAPDGASAVRGGFGSLWVTRSPDNAVDRVDPVSGKTLRTIKVGVSPGFLTVNESAIWVINQQARTVSRIDPKTSRVVATIGVSSGRIDGGDIASSADAVWVRSTNELAAQIDPVSNTVVHVIAPSAGSGSIAITADSVWISAHDVRSVWRLPTPMG